MDNLTPNLNVTLEDKRSEYERFDWLMLNAQKIVIQRGGEVFLYGRETVIAKLATIADDGEFLPTIRTEYEDVENGASFYGTVASWAIILELQALVGDHVDAIENRKIDFTVTIEPIKKESE